MCHNGRHCGHSSTDLEACLAGKGETLGPDRGAMMHTEPGESISRRRALERQPLPRLVDIGVGQVTSRLAGEYDMALDWERTRFKGEPYRCPDQVAITQD